MGLCSRHAEAETPITYVELPAWNNFLQTRNAHMYTRTHRAGTASGHVLSDSFEGAGRGWGWKPRGKGKYQRNMRLWGDLSKGERRNLNFQRVLKDGFKTTISAKYSGTYPNLRIFRQLSLSIRERKKTFSHQNVCSLTWVEH